MADTNIFQSTVATQFIYPFILMFFLVFAVLEKTKLLGENKKTLNAWIAGVIALIFVTAVFPKVIVGNMILYLTVAIVMVFVILLLWGFVYGTSKDGFVLTKGMKIGLGAVITIATILAVFWATGVGFSWFEKLFNSSWSDSFWSNFFFILVIGIALAVTLKTAGGDKK